MPNGEYKIRHPCDVSDLKREKTRFYDRNHKESDRFIVSQFDLQTPRPRRHARNFSLSYNFAEKCVYFSESNASKRKLTNLITEKWLFDETSYNSTKWETLIVSRIETEISTSSECLQVYVSMWDMLPITISASLHMHSFNNWNASTFFQSASSLRMYIYWWPKRRMVLKSPRAFL